MAAMLNGIKCFGGSPPSWAYFYGTATANADQGIRLSHILVVKLMPCGNNSKIVRGTCREKTRVEIFRRKPLDFGLG